MKKLKCLLILCLAIFLSSCYLKTTSDINNGERYMVATIKRVAEKIEVEVETTQVFYGEYWVITGEETKYFDINGNAILREDLKEGDKIKIDFPGQVMMSFPPQIFALSITIIE